MNIQHKIKKYHARNHRVYSCQYHVVFCPKYRRPVLEGETGQSLAKTFLAIAKKHGFEIVEQTIMSDHVHLLIDVDPWFGINTAVAKLKGESSRQLRAEFPELKSRLPSLWTRSAFISLVGTVSLERVQQYIASQKGV